MLLGCVGLFGVRVGLGLCNGVVLGFIRHIFDGGFLLGVCGVRNTWKFCVLGFVLRFIRLGLGRDFILRFCYGSIWGKDWVGFVLGLCEVHTKRGCCL